MCFEELKTHLFISSSLFLMIMFRESRGMMMLISKAL